MNIEKKYKSIDAERFIEACQEIIDKGIARSFKEIAEKSGYSSQDFTDIKSGKKDLQRKFLEEVSRQFPINEVYVFTGNGQSLKKSIELIPEEHYNEIQSSNRSDDFKQKEIEMWKELYRMQAELMEEIKKDRDRLKNLMEEKKNA